MNYQVSRSNPKYSQADGWLLAAIFTLLAVSVLMVFSTTAVPSQQFYGDATSMIKRHMIHVLLGLIAFLGFSRIDIRFLQRAAPFMLGISIALLILVLIPVFGHSAGGAQRWISLGAFRMQPGEICKILLIIYFAAYIDRHKAQMTGLFPGAIVPFGILAVVGALLLLEPDFGSTVVLTTVIFCQLFTASRLSHLLGLVGIAIVAGALLIAHSPYRMRRLAAFMDPFADPSSTGYQLIQSLIAVGSGGATGAGLGAGKQKLFYLPAAHTDFIYAVVAEELGLLGALAVLAVFLVILYRGILIARRLVQDPFLCALAVGCTLLVVLPALLNIGVVTGLLPTKGMVLPLVAYGGTAMIVHLSAMGILTHLSRIRPS